MAISEQDATKIASHFILSSPPGEINEVLTDVRTLLQNDALLNRIAIPTFREYNKLHLFYVQNPMLGYPLIISEHNEMGPNEYLDPNSNKILTFDHIQRTFTGEERPGDVGSNEPLRSAIDGSLNDYLSQFYEEGAVGVFETSSSLVICISAIRTSPQNFWNTRWNSEWKLSKGRGQQKLTGTIKVLVHFYEDGNVQLHTKKEIQSKVEVSDPESTSIAIAKEIHKIETEFQHAHARSYLDFKSSFKSLKLALPYTGTRMDWLNVLSKRISKTIGGT